MSIRVFTRDEMLKNALSNNTPSAFQDVLKILSWTWQDATFPAVSIGRRCAISSQKTTGRRRYIFPFAVPCWGGMRKIAYTDIETQFRSGANTFNEMVSYVPSDDRLSFSRVRYGYSTSWNMTINSVFTQSKWGFVFFAVESTDVASQDDIQNIYKGGSAVNFRNNTSYPPVQNGVYTGANTTDVYDTEKQICFGIPPFTGQLPLSGAFVENAKEFFNRLLLVPLPLWCHTCEPSAESGYTPPHSVYDQYNNTASSPDGHMRDSVIRMTHFVPYREGAPSWCNVLNIAIWETDKFLPSSNIQIGDFFLKVEIGGVEYDATVYVMGEISFSSYGFPATERGILCQVQAPPGIEGSFLEGGRRFWPVRISSYGRVCRSNKTGQTVIYTNGVCSVSAWLGGEIAKEGVS